MPYELKIKKKDNVLWVKAAGMRSFENVVAISKDIMTACAEQNIRKVLIDVRALKGRLSVVESYRIPDQYFPKIRNTSVITHCAIVDLKEFESNYRFFENVAVNRGFNLRIFSAPDEAFVWLTK